ncbi:MAG: alpha-amylase [Flavobacteriales bacterium]|nr:MAG: alpha-amylase [Flavobacteriales bacterium]
MQNQTLIQYFHWYYNDEQNLWTKALNEATNLAQTGITGVWFPPAYKGTNGTFSVGYDSYDMYDLGEFDQKNSVSTKYGSKDEYLSAIKALQEQGILVIADTIFNHKAGGDELEKITVKRVKDDDRNEFISDNFEIEAWTKFTFPGRQGKYSEFIWDSCCFSGIDWAEDLQESSIFAIQNEYGEGWEDVPSTEMGNYDYLMYNDIDFRNPAVREELKNWGKWYFETTGVDGFRLDAVKHISTEFLNEWLDAMREVCDKELLIVAENWIVDNFEELDNYIEATAGRTQLFDSLLHHNFYLAAQAGQDYDLTTIFDHTLVQSHPLLSITFVDNHDSQPLQSLESYVEDWFRSPAYAMILLREGGMPCVFYPDLYGASYEEEGNKIELKAMADLPTMLKVRSALAYGLQRDYLDHANCIGWTREGDDEHENSGLAVLLSNGEEGFKSMEIGAKFVGRTFVDVLGARAEEITINEEGFGEFLCPAGGVSVWVLKV